MWRPLIVLLATFAVLWSAVPEAWHAAEGATTMVVMQEASAAPCDDSHSDADDMGASPCSFLAGCQQPLLVTAVPISVDCILCAMTLKPLALNGSGTGISPLPHTPPPKRT